MSARTSVRKSAPAKATPSEITPELLRFYGQRLMQAGAALAESADLAELNGLPSFNAPGSVKARDLVSWVDSFARETEHAVDRALHAVHGYRYKKLKGRHPTARKTESLEADLYFAIEVDGDKRELLGVYTSPFHVHYRPHWTIGSGKRSVVAKARIRLPYEIEQPAAGSVVVKSSERSERPKLAPRRLRIGGAA